MFGTKFFAVALLAVATVATPTPQSDECNTGSIQCCTSTTESDAEPASGLLALLGVVLDAVVPVGLGCDPITAIGTGSGSTCTQSPVCCTGNSFSGLIVIGCSPININL